MGVGRPRIAVVTFAIAFAIGVPSARADVDWERGLVTATGLGIADRHAPSPAAARGPARRRAEEAARASLAKALPKLPLARGGTLGAKLDKAHRTKLAAAVAAARTIESTPETDGSWNVTLAVPIEAVRQVLAGRRTLAGSDDDPPIVVVEGVTAKPAVGYTIGKVAGASLWVKTPPAWAKDAPRVEAKRVRAGRIEIARPIGGPSTLFVLVAK